MTKEEIKQIRLLFKQTQREFAETIGASVYSVRNWERGNCAISKRKQVVIEYIREFYKETRIIIKVVKESSKKKAIADEYAQLFSAVKRD